MDECIPDFLIETAEALATLDDDLVRLEAAPDDKALIGSIFRTFHSIKGASGFLGLSRLGDVCHAAESVLDQLRDGALLPSPDLVSVLRRCIKAIKGIVATIEASGSEGAGSDEELIAELTALHGKISPALSDDSVALQALFDAAPGPLNIGSTAITDSPTIGMAWTMFPRAVRDLARKLGKKIELVMEGADTELDRHVLELIKDPLIHMIRNAADHGLETPDVRSALGKSEAGRLRLYAFYDGDDLVIEVTDDGCGLDAGRVRHKARASGLASEAEIASMADADLFRFILQPGFSTATEVTMTSGRGVGLDVVRTNIERLGGTIDIASRPNQGTSFTIRIPSNSAAPILGYSGDSVFYAGNGHPLALLVVPVAPS
jgi:two-component system chemotaxis sensor kinase CheA